MRVAHFVLGRASLDSPNGVDKTVFYLAKNQALLGDQVAIFAFTNEETAAIPGVEVYKLPPPPNRWLRILPHAPTTALRELLRWQPDIVHFHSVHIGIFVALSRWLKQRGVPYVVTPHGGFALGRLAHVGPHIRAYSRLVERPYLEGAKFVHAVSQSDVKGLLALGVRARVEIIPNGMDPSSVPSVLETGLLRGRFPHLKGKRVFLFLGRLDPLHKGLDLLLHAFARANLSEAALVLVGPDWRGSLGKLKNLVNHLRLESQVVFAGPASGLEKWSYLADADVFVHTSRWEAGLPFSVLEAMALSKPVLLSSAIGAEDVREYRAGMVVEADVVSIAEALSVFGNMSSEELADMGLRGNRLLKEKYNWESIAKRLREAYAS